MLHQLVLEHYQGPRGQMQPMIFNLPLTILLRATKYGWLPVHIIQAEWQQHLKQ